MKHFFTLWLLLLAGLNLRAQTLDPTFQLTSLKQPYAGGLVTGVQALVTQPDGKVLVAGGFDFAGGALASKLLRLNADGTQDATFNPSGTGANGFIAAMALQPDGKILIVGGFSVYNGTPQLAQARLNTDGTLDASFAGLPVAELRQLTAVAVQPDGKVLVGGTTGFGSVPLRPVVRLTASGTPDATFSAPAGVTGDVARAIVVQADGKIVVGGNNLSNNSSSGLGYGVERLNSNGSLDTSFVPGTVSGNAVYSLVQQPDGKLLVGGSLVQVAGQANPGVLRLQTSGVLDNTFVTGSGPTTTAGLVGSVRTLLLQANGSVLVGGAFNLYNGVARGRLVRLLASGALDPSFAAGAGANNVVYALAATTSGQVLAGGDFTQYDGGGARTGLVRLTTAGAEDAAFTLPLLEGRGTVSRAVLLANGQLLAQGSFTSVSGTALTGSGTVVRRFTATGTLDATYTTTASTLLGPQPDGSFFTPGFTTTGTTRYTLQRVLPTGALDAGFANPVFTYALGTSTVLFAPQGVVAQPDGKLLVYGVFATCAGVNRNSLVRLNADGTVDNSFVPPAGTQRQVYSVTLQASGKLLVAYMEIPSGPYTGTLLVLTRLNADGSVDNTFNAGGTGASAGFTSLLPQPDGKLLLYGASSYNGQAAPYNLLRLTADGALDNTFSQVAGFYSPQLVQPDGKMLVSTSAPGSTATYGSTQLLRLNPDGSRDATFAPIATPQAIFTGDNLFAGYLYQPADGKIIAYGSFTTLLGQVRGGLARIVPGVVTATRGAAAVQPLAVYPNPAHQQLTVALPTLAPAAQATLLSLTGQVVRRWTLPAGQAEATLPLDAVAAGLYVLRIPGAAGVHQQKVVVTP